MASLLNFHDKQKIEAGCDEAGRGCLAGPVVCAAVILPKDFEHPFLNDSKQISSSKRDLLRDIIEKEALAFAVCFMDEAAIAELNILKASLKGMALAAEELSIKPELLLLIAKDVLFTFLKESKSCSTSKIVKFLEFLI
uniref:hypothetical protein n=1 Tax=Fluviicola sp. TaxID=1917219 RepID=UPI00404ABECD